MRSTCNIRLVLCKFSTFVLVSLFSFAFSIADDGPKGIGDPGQVKSLTLVLDSQDASHSNTAKIVGRTNRLQVIVTAGFDSNQTRDWTHQVTYASSPAGVIQVDKSGLVTPLSDGEATVSATSKSGISASAKIKVERFANPPLVNFPNEIVPLFTKHGCNGGGCHGKSGGQNGFELSLLGFEPQEDFQHLVKEARGRRVFPASPDQSLLLRKATGVTPHGGGAKLVKNGDEYNLIKLWIEQGLPYGKTEDPVLEKITVSPPRVLMPLDGSQQLKVTAHYSDGAVRDVTRQAQFTANNTELAEATERGIVSTKGKPGIVAVMVRYQGQVNSFLGTVPLGAKIENLPKRQTIVDKFVFDQLKELGLPPSEICDDSTFIRRVTLDIAGRLPTLNETENFLSDAKADKRAKLVDRLLESDGYSSYFAQKWTSILRNKVEQNVSRSGNFLFHQWVKESLRQNMPYDKFVERLITASGNVRRNPAVNWHKHFKTLDERAEDTAQVFLGQRIQCAKCHHHPYEKWSQEDYWGFAAFYSNVRNKSQSQIYSQRGRAQARNPKTNQMVLARGLGSSTEEIENGVDARLALADWLTRPENPYFAKTLVNRYWKHFFGVGIVDPEDDMRGTNPPSNPELLDALAADFIEQKFNLKALVRTICNSATYQLSAVPNQYNQSDIQSFSKFNSRRLPAEVMLDSIDNFLGSTTRFRGLPNGMLATEIPDHGGIRNSFLDVFGRPAGSSACECERSGEITMAQCLQLLNSDEMYNKLSSPRVSELSRDKALKHEEKISKLYLEAFSRLPKPAEMNAFLNYIQNMKPEQQNIAYQDIMWTIVNTKEFMFNH